MGNLFSRNQPVEEIKRLRYAELREWNIWHEKMLDAESKIKCSKCGRVYDIRKGKCNCTG